MRIGYALSSEEHPPQDLVRWASMAEQVGFDFAMISDHYHPWTDRQGQSPFVWAVLGAVAQATQRIEVGTGVSCPTMRIHPAIIAQAAATIATMMPSRFFLGLGTGENLNEHIVGRHWPDGHVRLEMLTEAVETIQALWQGSWYSHRGRYFTVEQARLYTLPEQRPKILIAAGGRHTAELAARCDGIIAVSVDPDLITHFQKSGGAEKRAIGQFKVCWAPNISQARRTAAEWWPNAVLPPDLNTDLRLPRHFEQASTLVTDEQVAQNIICGPDPEAHLARIRQFMEAGFDGVCVHQVGPDQEGFFEFYERDILPRVNQLGSRPRLAA